MQQKQKLVEGLKRSIWITGASRGIGLALVRAFLQQHEQVFALCRKVTPELQKTKANIVEGVDITDPSTYNRFIDLLSHKKAEVLINNAGIFIEDNFAQILENKIVDSIGRQFTVNALGTMQITSCFLPYMPPGAKIAQITSRMGSVGDNTSGGYYGYRASKAALNMLSKSLALDLRPRKIAVGLYHPGYVKTDMTKGQGDIETTECAYQLLQRIEALTISNSGSFWHANGEIIPW